MKGDIMIEYDEPSDSLVRDGKLIKTKGKIAAFKAAAEYVIQQLSNGKNLGDYPHESENLPKLIKVINYIKEDKELNKQYIEAESSTLFHLKNATRDAFEKYKMNPNSDNLKAFEATTKMYELEKKAANQELNVSIEYNTVIPDDYWDLEPQFEQPERTPESMGLDKILNVKKEV